MKVIGIIVEHNPLQNGHEYQLKLAREQFHADYVILAMTGNFQLRGSPAIMQKEARAEHAISAGADLVIELPTCYSLDETPGMAQATVSLFESLGVVDAMLFGSELGDIGKIQEIAAIMASDEYQKVYSKVSTFIFKTNSRREQTLIKMGYGHYAPCVNNPNNLLGIRFVMALNSLDSSIKPLTHQRIGQAYFDDCLESRTTARVYSSASAVRKRIQEEFNEGRNRLTDRLRMSVPDHVYQWMQNNFGKYFPMFAEDCWDDIVAQIKHLDAGELSAIYGISTDYAVALQAELEHGHEYADYYQRLKQKFPNINPDRRFYRILTNQLKRDYENYTTQGFVFYANVLASSDRSAPLLEHIRKKARIPLISNLDPQGTKLSAVGWRQLENDRAATALYAKIMKRKFRG